jgi:hypothetical protein
MGVPDQLPLVEQVGLVEARWAEQMGTEHVDETLTGAEYAGGGHKWMISWFGFY